MKQMGNMVILPTSQEFLDQVQEFCNDCGWGDDEIRVSKVLGAIVEWILQEGDEPTFLAIVSRFHFVKAESSVLRREDPETWKKILGETET